MLRDHFLEEDLEEVYSEVVGMFEASYKALKSVENCSFEVKDLVLSQIMSSFNKTEGLNRKKIETDSEQNINEQTRQLIY